MCISAIRDFSECRNVVRLAFLSKRAALRLRVPALRDEIMTGDAHSLETAARLLLPRSLFPNSWGNSRPVRLWIEEIKVFRPKSDFMPLLCSHPHIQNILNPTNRLACFFPHSWGRIWLFADKPCVYEVAGRPFALQIVRQCYCCPAGAVRGIRIIWNNAGVNEDYGRGERHGGPEACCAFKTKIEQTHA